MKKATITSIVPKAKKSNGAPIIVITLSDGNTIIREEFQFERDCINSRMTMDEAILDCSEGGTVMGDFSFNAAGSKYIVDENSTLVKTGAINPATNTPYQVGDSAIREKAGMRVEKFLTFRKSAAADRADREAREQAKIVLQQRAAAERNNRLPASATEEEVIDDLNVSGNQPLTSADATANQPVVEQPAALTEQPVAQPAAQPVAEPVAEAAA